MSVLTFQMPQKVVVDQVDDNYGVFIFEPLEKGYGVTIGNSLRRVLLSSLDGYAVTSIRVSDVQHEFSTIEGVKEDLVEVILNLKKVRFKKTNDNEENVVRVSISGKDTFLAGDIASSSSTYQVLNPDLKICTLSSGGKFDMELTIHKGRGYVPAEEHNFSEQEIGVIKIDSIFNPVEKVKYYVENTRVEQSIDYEKLSVELQTDGSIDPESAMRQATDILMKHFALLSSKGLNFEPVVDIPEEDIMDDETLRIRKLLQTPTSRLNLSVRAANCLRAANVNSLGDLAQLKISDMMKFRNLGRKSLNELQALMEEKGLKFGMDVTKYKLDEEI